MFGKKTLIDRTLAQYRSDRKLVDPFNQANARVALLHQALFLAGYGLVVGSVWAYQQLKQRRAAAGRGEAVAQEAVRPDMPIDQQRAPRTAMGEALAKALQADPDPAQA